MIPGVVKIIKKVNIVTGNLLRKWAKSTAHRHQPAAVHQNPGKDHLTVSQLILAKSAYRPTALTLKSLPTATKHTYSLTTINSLNI